MGQLNALSSSKRTCLIVEDEALIGMDLEDVVRDAGYEPCWVGSLHTALRLIETDPPTFAIIDIKLHDGDGTDLVHQLQQREIPFIIHSGAFDEGSPHLRGIPWLSKPADPSLILNALVQALNRPLQPVAPGKLPMDDPGRHGA